MRHPIDHTGDVLKEHGQTDFDELPPPVIRDPISAIGVVPRRRHGDKGAAGVFFHKIQGPIVGEGTQEGT
jgi:hypothetical protein